MKQIILTSIIAFISHNFYGQGNNLILDTVYYGSQTYYAGKDLRLGEGTGDNKSFAHIMIGPNTDSLRSLPQGYAKSIVKVDLVYKNDFGYVIIASEPRGLKETADRIYIKVEHALFNKELDITKRGDLQTAALTIQN
jgi:hypothetical protein